MRSSRLPSSCSPSRRAKRSLAGEIPSRILALHAASVLTPRARVAAIIPALNEERTIADVIRAAHEARTVDRVLVVDNGSTDNTAEICRETGVEVILCETRGKGEALAEGVQALDDSFETLVFLDADLLNLKADDVDRLVLQVLTGESRMSCGILKDASWRKPVYAKRLLQYLPTLTGQRALRRSLFNEIRPCHYRGYGVEAALNRQCKRRLVSRVALRGVRHITRRMKHAGETRQSQLRSAVEILMTYGRLYLRSIVGGRPASAFPNDLPSTRSR
jgi:CTP:molybdopterin cytidylyltransferase MocA